MGAPISRELHGVDRVLGAGTVPWGMARVCLVWQMRMFGVSILLSKPCLPQRARMRARVPAIPAMPETHPP